MTRRVAERVGEQIDQHLLDPELVPRSRHRDRGIETDGAARRRGFLKQPLGDVSSDFRKIDRLEVQAEGAAGDSRHVQKGVDETGQPLGAPGRTFQSLRQRHFGGSESLSDALKLKLQRGERGSELVRGDRQELVP